MSSQERPFDSLDPGGLENRIRSLAQEVMGADGVDDIEMRHLLEIVTKSPLLLREGYDSETLDRILWGEKHPALLLGAGYRAGIALPDEQMARLYEVPDVLRHYGDKCLYDVGLAGRESFRGIDLSDLGPRAYSLAGQVLELLADDRTLRDFYGRNLIERLPIEDEVVFLRQCATRFRMYAQVLQAFRCGDAGTLVSFPRDLVSAAAHIDEVPPEGIVVPGGSRTPVMRPSVEGSEPRRTKGRSAPEEEARRLEREERLTSYEREILLSALDLEELRRGLKGIVIDQPDTVDRICDDLGLHALGTSGRQRPQSYLLVGPAGVGKNYLMKSLARFLEETWGVPVPLLSLVGARHDHSTEVSERRGAARGPIGCDEKGVLVEFHERTRRAPFSIIIVNEVEKAPPQLVRVLLSLVQRGTTTGSQGRILHFPATLIAFTANLPCGDREKEARQSGHRAGCTRKGRRPSSSLDLQCWLPPEVLDDLKVVEFEALSRRSAGRILDRELERIAGLYMARQGLQLRVSRRARQALIDEGFSETRGVGRMASRVETICNVEVSRRLHLGSASLSERGRRLLERIRQARESSKSVDEETLRAEVEQEIRFRRGPRRMTIDWAEGTFVYSLESR